MIYTWKPGSPFRVDPEVAARELDRIFEERGRLRPEDIVEESRPEDAPLHDEFEWDDQRAAELYRIEQARHIIRSLVVLLDDDDRQKEPVRAFVLVKPEDESPVYLRTDYALADETYREQVLERARQELESWRRRYEALLDFAQLLDITRRVMA